MRATIINDPVLAIYFRHLGILVGYSIKSHLYHHPNPMPQFIACAESFKFA